jgi:hypothetical protein
MRIRLLFLPTENTLRVNTKTCRLKTFNEIISVCRENQTGTLISTFCGKPEFLNVTAMGTYRVIQGCTNFPKI